MVASLYNLCLFVIINKKINFTSKHLPDEVFHNIIQNYNNPIDLISRKVELYGFNEYNALFTICVYNTEPNNIYLSYLYKHRVECEGKKYPLASIASSGTPCSQIREACEKTRLEGKIYMKTSDICVYTYKNLNVVYSSKCDAYLTLSDKAFIKKRDIKLRELPEELSEKFKYETYFNLDAFPKAIPAFWKDHMSNIEFNGDIKPGCLHPPIKIYDYYIKNI